MNKIPKKLKRLLAEQADRAWEAEMRGALAALAERFDQWRAGALSCGELDQAVHAYHNGIARDIWKRYAGNDPVLPVARAVALGILERESVPRFLRRSPDWSTSSRVVRTTMMRRVTHERRHAAWSRPVRLAGAGNALRLLRRCAVGAGLLAAVVGRAWAAVRLATNGPHSGPYGRRHHFGAPKASSSFW